MRTRGVSVGGGGGGAEREARRKKGGRGVAEALVVAADRMLTMDIEGSTIWLAVRMISLSDEARRQFFTAPVGAAAVASPAERAVA